jgi:hypothetical protein
MTMPQDPLLGGLSTFAGQTAGNQMGLQQQALSQQMQQFLMALQFQQQQAALQQASNYGTQFGFAPGGNWMTWGSGGPTQPSAGTPTLADLTSQMGLTQGGLSNALNIAGVTGQFAAPMPSQYTPGTVLSATDAQGAYGVVNADGSVTMLGGPALGQLAAQRGTTSDALTRNAAPVSWANLQSLAQGPPTSAPQQTLTAQQQAYQQALATGGITGQFTDPTQQMGYLLSQGKAMNGAAFTDLPPDQQQYWLKWNQNNPTMAAQQWARATNGALQGQGYTNPAAGPQQTLASQLQNAQLTGMYQGAPTLQAQGQYSQEAQNWASLYGYTPQLDANGQPIAPGTGGMGGAGAPQTLASQAQQAQLSGMYQGAPTETAREFNLSNALAQGQLGQQYLSTAAQLQGPQNTFQLSNYLRGAQGNPNVPVYLQNLANNMGMPSFQATGSTAPTPQSAGGLTSQLGYGVDQNGNATGQATSATPGWDYNQTLNQINQIAQRGAQGLGPGALERLTPDEMQAFGSGLGAAGYSLPSFMAQYNQSRVGQQAPVAQTSLA